MAWPWDDDHARADSSAANELLRAYGREEIGPPPRPRRRRQDPRGIAGARGNASAQVVPLSGLTTAERLGGLGASDLMPVRYGMASVCRAGSAGSVRPSIAGDERAG